MGNKNTKEKEMSGIDQYLLSNPLALSINVPPSPMSPNIDSTSPSKTNINKIPFEEENENHGNVSELQNYGMIPDLVVHNILLFCELEDLVNVKLACKLFQTIGNSDFFWTSYFSVHFGEEMEKDEEKKKMKFMERLKNQKNENYYRKKYPSLHELSSSIENSENYENEISRDLNISLIRITIVNDLNFYDDKSLFYNLFKDYSYHPRKTDDHNKKNYDKQFREKLLRTNSKCELKYFYKTKDVRGKYVAVRIHLQTFKGIEGEGEEKEDFLSYEDCVLLCFRYNSYSSFERVNHFQERNPTDLRFVMVGLNSELSEGNREVKKHHISSNLRSVVDVSSSPHVYKRRKNLRMVIAKSIEFATDHRKEMGY